MSWYAVYQSVDGKLLSIGSVLADPLPDGLTAKSYENQPDLTQVNWDAMALDFLPIVAPDPDPEITQMQNYLDAFAVQAPTTSVDITEKIDVSQKDTSNFVNDALIFLVKRELSRG